MHMPHEAKPALDSRRRLVRFWQSASTFWTGRSAWTAWSLSGLLIGIVLAQLLMQYLLNYWNRDFFDALGRRDAEALWMQAWLFAPLAGTSVALAIFSVWGRMTAQRKWREALTRSLITSWLGGEHFRQLSYVESGQQNPEYRIAEDARIATDAPVDLVLALISSVCIALTFFGVLWSVGGDFGVDLLGRHWVIPGYLVIGVIIYSGLFTTAMVVVSHPLSAVIQNKNQAEAEFRAAANVLREVGEGSFAPNNEISERRTLWSALVGVLASWRNLCWQLMRTTFISQSNFLLAPVVAWILCAPKYLAGTMSLGELTQAAAAFVTVQAAFNWLLDNYQRLADWQSSAERVATLLFALDDLTANAEVATDSSTSEKAQTLSMTT
jgi:ABC-type uncharacterized transport system fused permease/ATPase subunit